MLLKGGFKHTCARAHTHTHTHTRARAPKAGLSMLVFSKLGQGKGKPGACASFFPKTSKVDLLSVAVGNVSKLLPSCSIHRILKTLGERRHLTSQGLGREA